MSLNANKQAGGGNRPEPLEAGAYPARLVWVISAGLQKQEFMGESKPPQVQLYVTYELLDEFLQDEEGNDLPDKPRFVSENFSFYNLSSEKAKSTKRYFALDPEGVCDGDWASLVGKPCIVTLSKEEKKGKVYNNIISVSSMRAKEAAKAPELVNEPKVFDVDEPDMEVFKSLPEWLQGVIKDNLEYEGSKLQSLIEGGSYDKEEDSDDEDW